MGNKNNSANEQLPTLNVNEQSFFNNERESLSLSKLKQRHQKLSYLCLNLDPFNVNTDELSIELENLVNEFGLREKLMNPFEFTNIVLRELNKIEESIKRKLN